VSSVIIVALSCSHRLLLFVFLFSQFVNRSIYLRQSQIAVSIISWDAVITPMIAFISRSLLWVLRRCL